MRKHTMNLLSAVMYILSFFSFVSLVGSDFLYFSPFKFIHLIKFITAFLVFFFGYLGAFFKCTTVSDSSKNKKIYSCTMQLLFLAYCFIVIDFTLIDNSFGRNVSSIFSLERNEIIPFLKNNINIIPLATIKLFIKGYQSGVLSLGAVIENILGNFLVFMPFAVFLPIISRSFLSIKKYVVLMISVVFVIEFLQIIMLTGSLDIDDFILNLAGALAAFAVLTQKNISAFLSRFFFGVWQNEEKI